MKSSIFILLAYAASLGAANTSAPAAGVITRDLPVGITGFSFPLISSELLQGSGSGANLPATINGAAVMTIPLNSAQPPQSVLVTGQAYYLEATSGTLEGERLEIDVASTMLANSGTVAVDLNSPRSTVSSLAVGATNGCTFAIRAHVTLASFQTMMSPALVGNNVAASADSVMLYGSGGFTTFYLRADGVTWRRSGSTIDYARLVIAPDQPILVQLRSGAKTVTHYGFPRQNDFRVNLPNGTGVAATGFPVDITPVQFGGLANTGLPAQFSWLGNNVQSTADNIMVFDSAKSSFTSYYLRSDGLTWRTAGNANSFSSAMILKPDAFILVKRTNSNPYNFIVKPY
jgi:hypothetical protein